MDRSSPFSFTTRRRMRHTGDNAYNITLTVGFLLIVIAASFGRGDVLYENVGDSGNRVLLQIVPLVVITLGELFLGLVGDEPETPEK